MIHPSSVHCYIGLIRYVLDNRWHIRIPGLPCHLRNYFSRKSCWKIYDICNVLSRRKVKAKFCRNFYLLTSESKIQIRNVWNIEQIKHVLLHCYTVYDLLKMSTEYIMSLELININCKMTSRTFDSNFDKKHDNCYRSSRQYCLHYRGFTDVWKGTSAETVSPMLVLTNCHTILIALEVVWLIGLPVYKIQCTVVWCPSERSFLIHVISSDPVFTTLPPFRRTQSWQKTRNVIKKKKKNCLHHQYNHVRLYLIRVYCRCDKARIYHTYNALSHTSGWENPLNDQLILLILHNKRVRVVHMKFG